MRCNFIIRAGAGKARAEQRGWRFIERLLEGPCIILAAGGL